MEKEERKGFYKNIEAKFEKISESSTQIFGNPLIFIFVLTVVAAWFIITMPNEKSVSDLVRDCYIGFSFLAFFLIQRTLNKYNKALHVKLNELLRSHEAADNKLIKVEEKTHDEIDQISRELHDDIVNEEENTGGKKT
jgi:low affinity Fe/Cu permease